MTTTAGVPDLVELQAAHEREARRARVAPFETELEDGRCGDELGDLAVGREVRPIARDGDAAVLADTQHRGAELELDRRPAGGAALLIGAHAPPRGRARTSTRVARKASCSLSPHGHSGRGRQQ